MSERARISRLPERSVDDRASIYAILDDGLVCHASYVSDGRPVVIPTLYARDGDRILLHGSNSSGLARAARRHSPLSVGITHIDGLVVARSGFHSSANYRSVVVHGIGVLLEGDEHAEALDSIVEWLIPGRTKDLRSPTVTELRQTSVIALPLDDISAKARSGGPRDDPNDMASDVWAGVVPMRLVAGEAVPDEALGDGIPLPDYLSPFRR